MIRALTVNDLDEFIRVRLQSLKLNPEAFSASYEDGLDPERTKADLAEKDEENFTLGCFDGLKLVGMVTFIRAKRRKLKHKGSIFGMFIDPACRGQGLGRQLMEACIAKVGLIKGVEVIQISVSNKAKAAQQLYTQLGFQVWGREPKSMKVGEEYLDEIFMYKELKQKKQ